MDNLVFACVVPHSTVLIPLVSGPDGVKALASRAAMEELGRRMVAARPETIVVLETHSMLVDGAITLLDSARVHGAAGPTFSASPDPEREHYLSLAFELDRDLNAAIIAAAGTGHVPVVRVRYFLDSTPLTIAWGSLVPLWFLGATLTPAPKLVIGCTGRWNQLPRETYVHFGRALRAAIAATERRVGVVISTDMAHAHNADSMYGFDAAAAESDAAVVDAVRAGALERLLGLDQDWLDRAKHEAVEPLLTLHGLLEGTDWRADVLSYEVPTYFGMMCTAYGRQKREG